MVSNIQYFFQGEGILLHKILNIVQFAINLFVSGRERYSTHSADTLGRSPHHGARRPIRLQLGVQAARDGEEHQQDQGGDEQEQDLS